MGSFGDALLPHGERASLQNALYAEDRRRGERRKVAQHGVVRRRRRVGEADQVLAVKGAAGNQRQRGEQQRQQRRHVASVTREIQGHAQRARGYGTVQGCAS
eukprot:gene2872-biopygen5710